MKVDQYENDFAYQCVALRLPNFVRQFRVKNTRKKDGHYRFDFCFPDYWLIVEIDGGIWMEGGGAHSHPIDIVRNMQKQNDALLYGYSCLRFTPAEVTDRFAIGYTQRVLYARGWRVHDAQVAVS